MKLGDERISMFGPHRAPEWRWLRANWFREKRETSITAQSDDGVLAAFNFSKELRSCKKQSDFERLYFKYPDEYHAVGFWVEHVANIMTIPEAERPSIHAKRRHAAIEAYLLSGANHDVIANKLGITPNAVGVYENWFFDFRAYLHSPMIISTLYVRGDVAGTNACNFEHLLRLYGWKYGIQVVDELLTGTTYSEKLQTALRNDQMLHLTKNSAILARGPDCHPAVVFEATSRAIELHDRLRQAEIEAGKAFESEEKAAWINDIKTDMAQGSWCVVEIPKGAEKQAGAIEHRLAVQLGYEEAPATDGTNKG